MGIIQGLTEFLPVSSSGHLVLIQHLFGLKDSSTMLALDVALHFGTLVAVVAVFRREWVGMAVESWNWLASGGRGGLKDRPQVFLALMIVVATIPAVLVGFFLKSSIESLFVSPRVAGFGLLATGFILWGSIRYAKKREGNRERPSAGAAWVIGMAQALAITPGISRSGATIGAGLLSRFSQEFAAKFSFLMAVPAILGAVILEAASFSRLEAGAVPQVLAGTGVSTVTGFLAIRGLLRVIRGGKLHLFAYYCWAVGLVALAVL